MRQQELEEIVLKADALYKEAVRLLEAGEYTEALENWQEVKRLIPGYPDPQNVEATARKKLSVDSSDPEVVVSAFVRKIGSDTEFHDGSIAYKTAIDALTEARSGQAVLTPDRIFTSLESLNRSYPPGRRLELQWLHNLLGHMFFWRKQTAEHMALLAADLSDDEPQFRQICLVAVPNEWNGVGRWVHVVLQRRGAAKKKRSKSNRKESVGGEEEAKRVLIVLYLQTPNTEELPELENMDHDTELPMAAFLGALLFEPPQSEKLYYLAAENFKSIE
jgi:tetratricopeptide (TPR) repeat protein